MGLDTQLVEDGTYFVVEHEGRLAGWTAVATVLPSALASIANPGPHGFTEILYAYVSQTGNNGSAFGGLTGNTPSTTSPAASRCWSGGSS